MTIHLHELHRRRLETTAHLLEQALDRIEQLLTVDSREEVVRAVANTLRGDIREELLQRARQLRSSLGSFAEEFGLERRPMDIHQILNAELSTAWVMLENCRPKRMKGFGVPFTQEARQALEANLEELLEEVRHMRLTLQR